MAYANNKASQQDQACNSQTDLYERLFKEQGDKTDPVASLIRRTGLIFHHSTSFWNLFPRRRKK
jgi:hypothetical protein